MQDLERSLALQPYAPRLLIQWLADAPGTTLRELDGTIVFVDISGFTKMSERLARKGKVGAEEVTDVLDAVFTRLLSVAYGNGGSLIKFGGDALLIFFSGDDHAAAGARAAVGMRRMLREIGRIESSAGKITLRMSVGVHSGLFHFFLVGDSHRELVVTGPAASETVKMEGAASAGEILVSRATAALLPRNCLGEPKGEGILLRREPAGISLDAGPLEVDVEGVDLLSCIPVAIRDHLLSELVEPEHRQVTVAFVHFDGIDELVHTEGAEVVAFGLDELVTEVQQGADKHGVTFLGTDIDHDGGKIILVAGAPLAMGEDEERMLLALRSVVEADTAIPVRIGVNRGHVFSGDIGPPYRRTYTVMGDAVNLAARIMSKAEPGELLATGEVLETPAVAFQTVALEPFMVKGKQHPVHAFTVGAVAGSKHVEEVEDLPLVGRREERAALLDALDDARGGRGITLEVIGPPGIGKTRLLTELRAHASDCGVLSVACELYQASTAYHPFTSILRVAFGIPEGASDDEEVVHLVEWVTAKAPHLEPWLPLLAVPLDLELPPTPQIEELDEQFLRPKLEEVVDELLGLSLRTPTVFAFEDVHWMDDASSGLLQRLVANATERPWLIVATRRDEATGFKAADGPRTVTLRPGPLAEVDAAALLEAATETSPLRPDEIAMLADRSGGNPLFLKELLAATLKAGGIWELPDTIEAMVIAQIDRLGPHDRRLLRNASILGTSFTDDLMTALLEGDRQRHDEAAWRRLDDFVVEEAPGVRRFRHALMRDAAYEGLPYKRRQELHARVADAIVRSAGEDVEERSELLSIHFFHAQRFEQARGYSWIAGGRAQAKFANADAAMFYARALESARRSSIAPAELAEIYDALGDVRWRVGAYGEAADAYAAARRLHDDPVSQAAMLHKEAKIPYKAGRFSLSIRRIHRGLKALEGVTGEAAVHPRFQLTALYAGIRAAQGRYAEAMRLCQWLIEQSASYPNDDVVSDALGRAYYILDFCHVEQGRIEQASHSAAALAIYERLGNLASQADVMVNAGTYAYYQGNWDEATDLWEKARDARLRMGDAVEAALGTNNIGEIRSDQGRLEEAGALFADALKVNRAAGNPEGIAYALSNLARVASRSMRCDDAMPMFEEALAMFENIGDRTQVLETRARIAECFVLALRPEAAQEHAARTLQVAEAIDGISIQTPMLQRIRGYASLQQGRSDDAREAFDVSLVTGRARSADYEVALTLDAISALDHARGLPADEAIAHESTAIFDRLGVVSRPQVPLPG